MMPVQSTSRPTAGHSGTTNAQVFRFPLAPSSEPYKTLREWREAQGWGRWKTAQALIRSATPEERKSLPEVHVLAGHWARWEKGRNEPDGHRNAPF
jgi:hypothetical protein